MSTPVAGDRVGEYVLEERVGQGAFGQVWRARHHMWQDRIVAVKIPTDPEYVRALQAEGTAIHGLKHPNIVSAINFDPYSTIPYLAMEYVDGSSLRPVIRSRSVTPLHTAAILRQVLTGLAYAHGQGMVHRDIKPENILVSRDAAASDFTAPGCVRVTDFGLGKRTTDHIANSILYTASIQQGTELAGTIAYMSPEQRSGADVDLRSDIYSCGVMLFELLTGERPAGTELPSDLVPNLPRVFDTVFKRAYARLELRYPSATEFAAALAFASTSTQPAVPPPLPARTGQPSPGSCSRCQRSIAAQDQFCMHCGSQIVERVRRCLSCGAYPHPNDSFCQICGKGLANSSPNQLA
jgi:serine/threonine protein kinase